MGLVVLFLNELISNSKYSVLVSNMVIITGYNPHEQKFFFRVLGNFSSFKIKLIEGPYVICKV